MYKQILKPLLFRIDAEKAHHTAFALLRAASFLPPAMWAMKKTFHYSHPSLCRKVMNITFQNPVGMAAGLDKNALLYNQFANLGFGFIEIGTVTPQPQAGNAKPRLFRLKQDEALINRMGFNNDGCAIIAQRLRHKNPGVVVGVNIGKNKSTPNEDAASDYIKSLQAFGYMADYFVVNVSSPNTPGLRELQDKEPLTKILVALQQENKKYRKPILLKIAPDLDFAQIDEVIQIVFDTNIAGIVATNTTVSRTGLQAAATLCNEAGGLSGKPLHKRANEVLSYIARQSNKQFALIGVGGIFNGDDAKQRLDSGADLVQLYTGYIYNGPGIVKEINKHLALSLR